ncbi:hypothetical protein Bca4012_036409 [Brassica carinata]
MGRCENAASKLFASFMELRPDPANQTGFWVCTQSLWSDGEVVDAQISAGGAVSKVDLGFGSRWIWVSFTLEGSPELLSVVVAAAASPVSLAASSVFPSPTMASDGLGSLVVRDSSWTSVLCFVSASCRFPSSSRLLMGTQPPRYQRSWSVVFWSKLRLEWTSQVVMAGPGLSQPCFAYPPFGVAFGMVCGASDRSPVVNSNDRLSCYRFPRVFFTFFVALSNTYALASALDS